MIEPEDLTIAEDIEGSCRRILRTIHRGGRLIPAHFVDLLGLFQGAEHTDDLRAIEDPVISLHCIRKHLAGSGFKSAYEIGVDSAMLHLLLKVDRCIYDGRERILRMTLAIVAEEEAA